jgi:phosphoribosylformimino-5-aminoimidazole carboxamide ribotide isomerase
VQASGGVAVLGDLPALKAVGAAGAIVGRALYEGRFTLEEALRAG